MKTVVTFALLWLMLCLFGCSEVAVYYDGRELGAEELELLLSAAETEEETKPPLALLPWNEQAENEAEATVYWTVGGKVWHSDSYCRYLGSYETVRYYGSEEEAAAAGKERLCEGCRNAEE